MAVRASLKMPGDEKPWVNQHSLVGVPASKKMHEAIQLGWWAWQKAKKPIAPDWAMDLNPQLKRKAYGPVIPCITTKTILYLYNLDRCADSEDTWAISVLSFSKLKNWTLQK